MAAQSFSAKDQAPAVLLAERTKILAVSVTSAATVHVDLNAFPKYSATLLAFISIEPMYYAVSSGAVDDIDAAAVAGDTRCFLCPANHKEEGFPPARYLHLRADSTTAIVRIYQSSP